MNPLFMNGLRSRPLSRKRKLLVLLVAVGVDTLRLLCGGTIGFVDPLDDLADVLTALILWLIIGPSWAIGIALVVELIPGIAIFPTWTGLALLLLTAPTPQQSGLITSGDNTPVTKSHP